MARVQFICVRFSVGKNEIVENKRHSIAKNLVDICMPVTVSLYTIRIEIGGNEAQKESLKNQKQRIPKLVDSQPV